VTAFIQNLRGIGDQSVDDNVSILCWLSLALDDIPAVFQFTIIMHYPRTEQNPYLLTVILRAHPLSQRTPQLRFTVRGSKGTFVKFGLDVQEQQMKDKGVSAFDKNWFGREPEYTYAELELVEGDNTPVKSRYTTTSNSGLFLMLGITIIGLSPNEGTIESCTGT